MQNQAAVEALYSATFVEDYLDCVENLPDDLQRQLSRLRELDLRQHQVKSLVLGTCFFPCVSWIWIYFQEFLCSSFNKLDCVNHSNFNVSTQNCAKPCSGLVLTSFSKSEQNMNLKNLIPNELNSYNKYKKITPYPLGFYGKIQWWNIILWCGLLGLQNYSSPLFYSYEISCNVIIFILYTYLDLEWKNDLRFVRIYFDTPTFEKITKDRAAKFVDMLSAIGGTMGLLTGFSIISAVEMIYFAAKIMWNFLQKNKKTWFVV